MPEFLRNLLRRPGRTALTATGVAIAVLGFTVLGAVAERLHVAAQGAQQLFEGRIVVLAGGSGLSGILLPEQVSRICETEGVEAVVRRIHLAYAGSRGMPFGLLPSIQGVDPADVNVEALGLRAGRHMLPGERGVAVVGAALAVEHGWQTGDLIDVHGMPFRVVGVLRRSLTVSDQWILVPYQDALALLLAAAPWLQALYPEGPPDGMGVPFPVTALEVLWTPGTDPEELSRRIQAAAPDATVLSPKGLERLVADQTAMVNLLVLAVASVGLFVGGVAVMNTTVTAVVERRSEMAIKQALGAPAWRIVCEVTAEAAAIGLAGGVAGVLSGAALAAVLNRIGAARYTEVCAVTGRLVVTALVLAVVLSIAAGLGPAWRAAKEPPAAALRDL